MDCCTIWIKALSYWNFLVWVDFIGLNLTDWTTLLGHKRLWKDCICLSEIKNCSNCNQFQSEIKNQSLQTWNFKASPPYSCRSASTYHEFCVNKPPFWWEREKCRGWDNNNLCTATTCFCVTDAGSVLPQLVYVWVTGIPQVRNVSILSERGVLEKTNPQMYCYCETWVKLSSTD